MGAEGSLGNGDLEDVCVWGIPTLLLGRASVRISRAVFFIKSITINVKFIQPMEKKAFVSIENFFHDSFFSPSNSSSLCLSLSFPLLGVFSRRCPGAPAHGGQTGRDDSLPLIFRPQGPAPRHLVPLAFGEILHSDSRLLPRGVQALGIHREVDELTRPHGANAPLTLALPPWWCCCRCLIWVLF